MFPLRLQAHRQKSSRDSLHVGVSRGWRAEAGSRQVVKNSAAVGILLESGIGGHYMRSVSNSRPCRRGPCSMGASVALVCVALSQSW